MLLYVIFIIKIEINVLVSAMMATNENTSSFRYLLKTNALPNDFYDS